MIIAIAALDQVIAKATQGDIRIITAINPVITQAAKNTVIAGKSADRVIAVATIKGIGTVGADNGVIPITGIDDGTC
ncbi:MAG: hypothetical protein INF55_13685 [Roseomonas sp.]|nr:hypothetical protein [Roseomonas sp.]MCA3374354.1 hypothetical protein [Roseomonas sp.]